MSMNLEPAPTKDELTTGPVLSPLWENWFNKIKLFINDLLSRVTTNETNISTNSSDIATLQAAFVVYTATYNPSSISAQTTSAQSITVTGVLAADYVVSVSKPSHTTGVGIVNSRVSANDTVVVTFCNVTAGAIDPPSETYTFVIKRG